MELRETASILPRVVWLDEVDSTNVALRELVAREGGSVPHGTLVATANQTAGRGRQGREWVTPPGTAIASSLLIRGFDGSSGSLGPSWLPLLTGSAVVAALQPLYAVGGRGERIVSKRVGMKWPNDVHVRDEQDAEAGRIGPKLCGILCEVLSDGSIVVGAGINLLMNEWELPTDRATSLLASGAEVGGAQRLDDDAGWRLADRVLHDCTAELLRLVALALTNPQAVSTRVLRDSLTVGAEVRVHLPDGVIVEGRAVGLDGSGALIVDRPTSGQLIVNAADVEHLR